MKKSLSLLLAIAMVFGMFASVAAAADNDLTTEQKYQWFIDQGYLKGNPDGNARLGDNLTRAEFATIVVAIAGLQPVTSGQTFADVKPGQWWHGAIEAAARAGLVNGVGAGRFAPKDNVTVEQIITVAVRLLDLDPVEGASVEGASAWAAPYIQAALDAGLITARDDYKAAATRGTAVDISYTTTQNLIVADISISSYNVVDSKNVEFTLSNGEVVKVTLEKALEENKETDVSFEYTAPNGLKKTFATKVTWVVEIPKVEKISQTNFAELEITYNIPIDKDSLKIGNVKVNGTALASPSTISLLEDGKTVRIYKADGFVGVGAQQAKVKVSLSGVKAANGKDAPEIKDQEITFTDLAFPTLVSAQAVGTKKIVLTFSEPILNNVDAKIFSNYKIDGNLVVGSGQPSVNGRTIEIVLASGLAAGEHKVSVAEGKLKDYAGFAIGANEAAFTVAEDKTAPTVSLVSADQNKIVVQYSEEVIGATTLSNVYWKNGSINITADGVEQDSNDKTKYTYTFSDAKALPLTSTKVYFANIEDFSGNKNSNPLELEVTASADVTRPTLVKAESKSESSTVLFFSENVRVGAGALGTITVKDKDGNVVASNVPVSTLAHWVDTSVTPNVTHNETINFTVSLDPTKSPYKFEIVDVEDASVQRNKLLQTFVDVTVVDKTAPTVPTGNYILNVNAVSITFSEKVDAASALNRSNYMYRDSAFGYQPLPAEASLTLAADSKSVVITFPASWTVNGQTRTPTGLSDIQVANISDLAGNKLFSVVLTQGTLGAGPSINTVAAVATSTNEIFVPVSGLVDVYAGDFGVYADVDGSGTYNAGDVQLTVTGAQLFNRNGVDGVKLTVANTLNSDGTFTVSGTNEPVLVASINNIIVGSTVQVTKNAVGQPVNGTTAALGDGIAPTLTAVRINATNSDVVELVFSESISARNIGAVAGNAANLATVMEIRDNSGQLTPGTDYTTNIVSGNILEVTITKTPFTSSLPVIKMSGIYIWDGVNVAADINTSLYATVRDNDAPTVLTQLAAQINAGGNGTIVFSEPLSFASRSNVEAALRTAAGPNTSLSFSWNGGTLTITNNGTAATTFTTGAPSVPVTLVDDNGNSTPNANIVNIP